MVNREKNTKDILNKFINDYPDIKISKLKIQEVLHTARIYKAYYIKDVYTFEDISNQNEYSYFPSMKVTLFKKVVIFYWLSVY